MNQNVVDIPIPRPPLRLWACHPAERELLQIKTLESGLIANVEQSIAE